MLNQSYFDLLYEKHKTVTQESNLIIGVTAYPVSIASETLLKELPFAEYESLKKQKDELCLIAKSAKLWIKKMQAGVGSSVSRSTYLARKKGIPLEAVRLGCKGTDLFAELDGKDVSIAEIQLLQAIIDAENGFYSKVIVYDIVSEETLCSVKNLWNSPCFFNTKKTYEKTFQDNPKLEKYGEFCQKHQPTIDDKGKLSTNRTNPGGHGIIGFASLRAAYIDDERPAGDTKGLIGVVGNGEDLGSSPDPLITGWMIKNNVPIAMITTEKTELDMKGGQIALVKDETGFVYVTIIEKAQAEQVGQLELFELLGLRPQDRLAFFNTNTALFNYEILVPLIKKLIAEMGEQEFTKQVSPDLIRNVKTQVDSDGVKRQYVQLEGAMGSCLLNFDKLCRKKLGRSAVHFLNVEKKSRTRFFNPIKTAFDFFLQFHSDVFKLDTKDMRLLNTRDDGFLPSVTLKDSFYDDVENVLLSFKGVKMRKLKSLVVEGKVNLCGVELDGDVKIKEKQK